MTMQADRASATDTGTADSESDASRKPAAAPTAPGRDGDAPAGQKPELSEAIDRATAAVGQDDGKR